MAKSDKAHEARIEAMQAEIRQMIADASDVQLKELRRPRKIAAVLGFLVVLVVGIPILVGNILDTMTMTHERDRVYGIEMKNEFLFDCAGEYDEQQKVINCGEFEINGKYTHYATTSLWAGSSSGFLVNGNEFTKKLSKMSISKSFWETENFDLDKLVSYGSRTEKFGLYNEVLDETVFEKSAEIRYVFSEETYALVQELHEKWKIEEAERKAREEAERKAREEERKAKEEAEKRAKEEAEQREREEAERREREEAEQKAAEERARQEVEQYSAPVAPYTPPASNPAPSTPGYTSPSSGVNYNVSGYCNDGTYVTGNPAAKGKANACYGHGGWRDY